MSKRTIQSGRASSLPQRFFHPLQIHSSSKCMPQSIGHSANSNQSRTRPHPSYPRAQAPQDQLKNGAENAQNQPNIKSDEDNFNQPYSNTNMSTFNSAVDRVDNLSPISPPVLARTKENRTTRRKAKNACYQSAALPTPSSPSDSHGLGLAMHPKQGPVGLEWRWSMGSGE